MKIREIRADGFGALRDRTVTLNGQIAVLFGPNEAGKSTLLQLIRAVLFGFPPRHSGLERFEPVRGGAHGGSLLLEQAPDRLIRVHRRSGEANGGRGGKAPSAGVAGVTLPDGTTGGEELLRELLGGVTAEQFRNLFAFTLTELQELHTLTSEELGGFLHSAGLGIRASAVREMEKRLTQELESRFRPKGRSQGIGLLLGEWEALDAAWRRSLAQAGRYNKLAEDMEALSAGIAGTEGELAAGRSRLALLEAAAGLRERWLRLRHVTEELAHLPESLPFPEDGLARQEALLAELEKREAGLAAMQLRLAELAAIRDASAAGDVSLVGLRDKLLRLTEELSLYRSGFAQEEELLAEQERVGQLLRGKLEEAGAPADSAESPVQSTLQTREEAFRWKELWEERELVRVRRDNAMEAAEEELKRAGALLKARQEELDQAERRLAAAYPPDADRLAEELPVLIRELRRDYALLGETKREVKHIRERELEHRLQLEQLQAQAEAGGQASARDGNAAFGRHALWAVLLGLGSGGGLFFGLAGRWLPFAASIAAAAAAGVGLLFRRGVQSRKGAFGRSSRPYPPGNAKGDHAAASPLAARRQEVERELDELDLRLSLRLQALGSKLAPAAPFPLNSGNEDLPEQLEEWSARLGRELQSRSQLADKLREAQEGEARLRRQLDHLVREQRRMDQERAELLSDWSGWLREQGAANARLSPGAALDFVALLDQAKELRLRLEEAKARLGRIRKSRQAYETEAAAVLGEAVAGPEELQQALLSFRREAEQAEGRLARRREAEAELEQLEPRLRLEEEAAARCRERLASLWRLGQASEEEEFRRLGALHASALELRREEESHRELLAAAVGLGQADTLGRVLEQWNPAELAEETERLRLAVAGMTGKLDRLKEEKGKLGAEYARLADGSDHGELREKQEELLARFGEEAGQWAVYALAAGLLANTKSRYEREKQPEVMKRASEHFARLTGGRYARIAAPMGEQRLLAIRPDGEAVDSARLSRGTAEQLYLAIRFALAGEFAKRTPLPLIMDDIFVNFDEERLTLALGELAVLSDRHQILLFTCHRHVLEAVARQLPSAQQIILPGAESFSV